MAQAQGKVLLKFDVFPEEKEQIEELCKQFGITKIEFLRRAKVIAEDHPELFQSPPTIKNSAGESLE